MGISDYLSGGGNAERRMRLSDLVAPKTPGAGVGYNVGQVMGATGGALVDAASKVPGAVSNFKDKNPVANAAANLLMPMSPSSLYDVTAGGIDAVRGMAGAQPLNAAAPGALPPVGQAAAPRNPPAGAAPFDTKAWLAGGTPGPIAQSIAAPPAAPLAPPPVAAAQLIAPAANPNQLSPQQQSRLDSLVAGQGFQDAPDGTGVVQSTNPDGSQNAPIRIGGNTGIGSDRQRLQSLVQPSTPGSGDLNWDRAASIVGPNRNMGSLVVGGTDFGPMLQAIHNNRQIDRTNNVMAGLGNADKKDADVGLIEENTVSAKAKNEETSRISALKTALLSEKDPAKAESLRKQLLTLQNTGQDHVSIIDQDTGEKDITGQPIYKKVAVNTRTGEILGGAKPKVNIPSAAIDFLKKNPNAAKDFDAKYGAGAAANAMGN